MGTLSLMRIHRKGTIFSKEICRFFGGRKSVYPIGQLCVGVRESHQCLKKLVNLPNEQKCLGISPGILHTINEFANCSTPGCFACL